MWTIHPFLQGDTKELNQELIGKMEQAAEALEFEKLYFIVIASRYCARFKHNKQYLKDQRRSRYFNDCLPSRCDLCTTMHVRNGRMLGGKVIFQICWEMILAQMLNDFMANSISK